MEELNAIRITQPQAQKQNVDPSHRDLGEWLQDPGWAGWTLARLREEQPDHLYVALGQIGALQQWERSMQVQQKQMAVREREAGWTRQVEDLRKSNPEYFDSSGYGNEKFETLYKWAAQNEVWNLAHAHYLMNRQIIEDKIRKESVEKYLQEATKNRAPLRANVKDTSVDTRDISTMDDRKLQEAYMNSSNPQTLSAIEAELVRRSIL